MSEPQKDSATGRLVTDPLSATYGDMLIRDLVQKATFSEDQRGFPVVVQSGGMLVSGQIIGQSLYFELLGEYMAGHVEEEDGARAIREYWNSYAQASAIPDGMNVEEADQPEYIHLADTRLYHHSGKAIPNNDTVLWRGRLSDISGFYFGALSNED